MAFRSGLEEKVADLLCNLGVKYEYESTKVPYVLQCNYTPDFLLPNGIYLETKGHLTEEDRRKMKAVKAANPDLDIRFVFQPPTIRSTKDLRQRMPNGPINTAFFGVLTTLSLSNG